MRYTDNPVRDAEKHSYDQDKKLENLPKCSECGIYIQDDMCYEIFGEYLCEDCVDKHKICTPQY